MQPCTPHAGCTPHKGWQFPDPRSPQEAGRGPLGVVTVPWLAPTTAKGMGQGTPRGRKRQALPRVTTGGRCPLTVSVNFDFNNSPWNGIERLKAALPCHELTHQ